MLFRSKQILDIRNRLKGAHEERELAGYNAHFTPFSKYKEIKFKHEYGGYEESDQYTIEVFRDETDEEYNVRIETQKKQSIAAKKAAITRKESAEKRQRTLFENLKKKYETNI